MSYLLGKCAVSVCRKERIPYQLYCVSHLNVSSPKTPSCSPKIDEMSGCELKHYIDNIGYENIALYSDSDELLKHFSTSDLIDSICNDNDRDIHHIIKELFDAEIELNSENSISLKNELNNLLSKIK